MGMTHVNTSTDGERDEDGDQALQIVDVGPQGVEDYVTPWLADECAGSDAGPVEVGEDDVNPNVCIDYPSPR